VLPVSNPRGVYDAGGGSPWSSTEREAISVARLHIDPPEQERREHSGGRKKGAGTTYD